MGKWYNDTLKETLEFTADGRLITKDGDLLPSRELITIVRGKTDLAEVKALIAKDPDVEKNGFLEERIK